MEISLGVYLSPKLVEKFPQPTQDLIWIYKIKKFLGSPFGIERSLNNRKRSFKEQHDLITDRKGPRTIRKNPIYALGLLEIIDWEAERFISYMPIRIFRERHYMDLVALYGSFPFFVHAQNWFNPQGSLGFSSSEEESSMDDSDVDPVLRLVSRGFSAIWSNLSSLAQKGYYYLNPDLFMALVGCLIFLYFASLVFCMDLERSSRGL